jgi:hypothetical protein
MNDRGLTLFPGNGGQTPVVNRSNRNGANNNPVRLEVTIDQLTLLRFRSMVPAGYVANEVITNSRWLLESFEQAHHRLENGTLRNSERGSCRILALYSVVGRSGARAAS